MKRALSSGHFSYNGTSLRLFSESDLERIHLATLEVMEKTGLWIEDDEALSIFKSGGAIVDRANRMVKIPVHMVEAAIQCAPSQVILANRIPEKDVVLEGDRVSFGTFGIGTTVIDLDTGQRRDATCQDYMNAVRLVDALDHLDVAPPCLQPVDVDPRVWALYCLEGHFLNASKPMAGNGEDRRLTERALEMAATIVGGMDKLRERPIIYNMQTTRSPLAISSEACGDFIDFARAGLPSCIVPMVMAGGTGPISLAGTLVVHNAEVLAALTLAQLTRKGAPIIYGSATTALDLRKSLTTVGCPELAMLNAGVSRISKYYNLPCLVAGGWSDSKLPDMQAGHEKILTFLLPALAGANSIFGAGELETGITLGFGQLVADNEFISVVKQVLRGIPVDDESLAVDVIREVGARGHFLAHEHTFDRMKTEHFLPELIDRNNYEQWQAQGEKSMAQHADEKAKEIIESHQPEPLPEGVAPKLRSIIMETEKELGIC